MTLAQTIEITGVHPVEVTQKEFEDAVSELWGTDLVGIERERAEQNVREHFASLYLIEVKVHPPNAVIDWDVIGQASGDNKQAPYDEQLLTETEGRWAFFFHFLDLTKPLRTEVGEIELPSPTLMPEHLAGIRYKLP